MKRLFTLLLAVLLMGTLVACTNDKQTASESSAISQISSEGYKAVDLTVMGLKGPTGMGLSKLMDNAEAKTAANNYTFKLTGDPTEVAAAVVKGEVDLAAVPTNLASTLYKKTNGKIQVIALNTLGVLYMLEDGNTINSVADLAGKTVYATGEGSTPEYILNYILKANGLDPEKDLTIKWMGEHAELVSAMATGKTVLGMLPEPNVSTAMSNNAKLRIALNMTEEWKKATSAAGDPTVLTQGCLIVRKEVLDTNPAAIEKFLEEYKASVDYVNADPAAASQIIAKHGIVPKAPLAQKAIPNCNICCITGAEMKASLSAFLKVLYEADPTSVGGQLPNDAFYYTK